MDPEELATRGVKRYWPHMINPMSEDDLLKYTMERAAQGPTQLDEAYDMWLAATGDPLEEANLRAFLRAAGVDIPQNVKAQHLRRMVKDAIANRAAAKIITTGLPTEVKVRMANYGSFDMARTLKGTLEDKVTAGFPIAPDTFEGVLRYIHAADRRYNVAQVIGHDGKLLDTIMDAIQAESGLETRIWFNDLIHGYLNNNVYSEGMRTFAKYAISLNTASKMTFGPIANFTQPTLTTAMTGLNKMWQGFWYSVKGENRDRLLQTVALNHSMVSDIGFVVGETGLATKYVEKLAEWTLRWSGFSGIEAGNRLWSAGTGELVAKDLITKAAYGSLKGNTLDTARRTAMDLGFNLDEVAKFVYATRPELSAARAAKFLSSEQGKRVVSNAGYNLAEKTQFIPGKFRRPTAWQHPIGRVVFQFKTFAVQMSRFIRDQIVAEAAAGNTKPLAYLLATAPVAGEFVADTRAFIKGDDRPDNIVARLANNMLSVGTFALMGDLLQSSLWGQTLSMATGPTTDTVVELIEASAQAALGNKDDAMRKASETFHNLPLVQATMGLAREGSNFTPELVDSYHSATSQPSPNYGDLRFKTPGERLQDALREKRRSP
jgi:hypothetical protein